MALTFLGNPASGAGGFTQVGPPRWLLSKEATDLDRLIIPMDGRYNALEDYLDTLDDWDPAALDGDMFLAGVATGTHKQMPTVDLSYIGKRGGILAPGRHGSSRPVQTAQSGSGASAITFVYRPVLSSYSWISREEGEGGIDPLSLSLANGFYPITGSCALAISDATVTGTSTSFTTQVAVGDYVAIAVKATNANGAIGLGWFTAIVDSVADNTHFEMDRVWPGLPGTGWSYDWANPNQSWGGKSINIEVVAIKGCGWSSIVGSDDPSLWGSLLITALFTPIWSTTIESEELVPGEYWINTQHIVLNLLQSPC